MGTIAWTRGDGLLVPFAGAARTAQQHTGKPADQSTELLIGHRLHELTELREYLQIWTDVCAARSMVVGGAR